MEQLQALIDALTTDRDNPPAANPDPAEFFSAVDDDSLQQMVDTAVEAAAALQAGKLTEDSIAQLEVLADTISTIRAEVDRREESAAALASRAEELAAKIGPTKVTGDDEDGDETVEAALEGDILPPANAPAPAAPVARTTASTTVRQRPKVDLAALRKNTGSPTSPAGATAVAPAPSRATITAASDLPGYSVGTELHTVEDLAQAISARFASFPIGSSGVEVRGGIATVRRNFPDQLVASGNAKSDEEMIEFAADERRLPGGSLAAASLTLANSITAAASDIVNRQWCAVYEIDQTLCPELETLDGFIDVPTIGVRPPGLVYAQNLDWWNIFDLATLKEFCDPCAGPKPCISMPCPEFTNADVCVEPFCIESCILKERANPQWTEYFVRRSINAFRRWQNLRTLDKILASPDLATAVQFTDGSWGAGYTTLDILSYVATYYRELYRMGMNSTMEVVAPHWLKNVIRDDLARRFGCGCTDVTDAQIMSWFANRGLRVQWIYDWQPIAKPVTNIVGPPAIKQPWPPFGTTSATALSGANIGTGYPNKVEVLVYPAGTFVAGRTELFRMDGLYDAANLKNNRYTKVFFEDGVIVLQRCYHALRLEIPLCINGGSRFATMVAGATEGACPVIAPAPAP